MNAPQPKTIPNPLYCDRCKGRGYVVYDSEWEPYAVRCTACEETGFAVTRPPREAPHE